MRDSVTEPETERENQPGGPERTELCRETPALAVVCPLEEGEKLSPRLREVLEAALAPLSEKGEEVVRFFRAPEAAAFFRHRIRHEKPQPEAAPFFPVLFVLPLGRSGVNLEFERLLRFLREEKTLLTGCAGGVLSDGETDFYTKSAARRLVLSANLSGCAFPGRPLVEGTGDLANFRVMAERLKTDLSGAYRRSAEELVRDLTAFRGRRDQAENLLLSEEKTERAPEEKPAGEASGPPTILVLHASLRRTSNTLALWKKTSEALTGSGIRIRELSLMNGTLYDCAGCPYRTCLHFGEQGSCFYGGVMAEEVYPAVREADGIVMLCANYNDALSANLTAFINRLTALFRQVRFYDKALFAVIVSGYSGGDIMAEQLIGAMNMNKTFYLPPYFALFATANDAGSAVRLPGIEEEVGRFAARIRGELSPEA